MAGIAKHINKPNKKSKAVGGGVAVTNATMMSVSNATVWNKYIMRLS